MIHRFLSKCGSSRLTVVGVSLLLATVARAQTPCFQLAGPTPADMGQFLAARQFASSPRATVLDAARVRSTQPLAAAYERIAKAARISPVLLVCDSGQLNAMAFLPRTDLPLVLFEARLLALLQDSEGEIASVLGHEFAHLILGHHLQMGNAQAILGRANAPVEQKHMAYSRFSREKESQADEKGFSLAVSLAGYPADSQKNAAEKLLRVSGRAHATYLDSHPGWLERQGKAARLSSNQHYLEEARRLSRAQDMRQLGELTQTWLQAFPDSGAGWYYRGIYLIRQSRSGSAATGAFESAVNSYLGSKDLGALAQEDETEVDDAWLQLCAALNAEGFREESLNCHGKIRNTALREDFARRNFDGVVIISGERQSRSDLWIARSASGSKLITNDESIAASRKQYSKLPPAWNAIRFPAASGPGTHP